MSTLLRRGCLADAYTPAAAGPTYISTTVSTVPWTGGDGSTNSRTISSVAVQTGDLIVVFGAGEDSSCTMPGISDTSTNTWTSRQSQTTASNCTSRCWTAVANASTSITITVTIGNNVSHMGACALVFRNAAYGTSSAETNTTEAPSLNITTTKANSMLAYIEADWNAGSGARTWRTIGTIGTERAYAATGSYTVYVGTWADTGATGVKAAGLSAPSGQKTSQICVEVTSP